MKTEATSELPEIEWDQKFSLLSADIDEREEVYTAMGTGSDGKEYTGIATFSCNELVWIEHIEEKIYNI